jgi:hypothetical protein
MLRIGSDWLAKRRSDRTLGLSLARGRRPPRQHTQRGQDPCDPRVTPLLPLASRLDWTVGCGCAQTLTPEGLGPFPKTNGQAESRQIRPTSVQSPRRGRGRHTREPTSMSWLTDINHSRRHGRHSRSAQREQLRFAQPQRPQWQRQHVRTVPAVLRLQPIVALTHARLTKAHPATARCAAFTASATHALQDPWKSPHRPQHWQHLPRPHARTRHSCQKLQTWNQSAPRSSALSTANAHATACSR